MNESDSKHPSAEQLQALVLGRVEDAEATALGSHVWACEVCLANLEQLSDHGDPFLSKLRAVHSTPRSDALPQNTLVDVAAKDTATATPPKQELIGELTQLAQYRVLRRLGQGGMGVVFEAEDVKLRRRVALKILKPSIAQDPSAQQRFLREARAAAGLHHDHVVTIYQVGEADGPAGPMPFLAMELLEGVSLESALAQRGLALADAVRIGREVAEGLAAAHAAGLIHRDVKPDNIWLEGDAGRVKLLDFGLARAVGNDAHLTAHGLIVGTPAYMAPEQAAGKPVDGRADLFSLGCVLYRLCTGRLPFPTTDVMATLTALATLEPAPVRRLNPAVPPALAELIHRLLAKAPADRPTSAAAVAAALRDVEDGRASPSRCGRRRALLIGVAGLTLLAGMMLLRPWDRWKSGGAVVNEVEPSEPSWAIGPGDGSGYATAWREDFEKVPSGDFPAEWVRANNARKEPSGVEVGQAAQGERSLRLFGAIDRIRAGDAQIALPGHAPFTLRYWVRQGDEPLRHNVTHAQRGQVVFEPVLHDESPHHTIFHPDGRLVFPDMAVPLPAHRWREVVVRYDRVGAKAVYTYWVDAAFANQSWSVGADSVSPTQLELTAHCGSLWFDDVHLLADADTPADRAVTAAWLAALRQWNEKSGPAAYDGMRAFADKYREAPVPRHRQLAQAAAALVPAIAVAVLSPAVTFAGHVAPVFRLVWAPDGQTLGSTALDGTTRLWRRDGTPVRQLSTHLGGVPALAFAPNGRDLATTGMDGILRVYRDGDGENEQTVQGQVGPLRGLTFAGDGRLLTAGEDGAVRAWDLSQGKPVEVIEQRDSSPLTDVQVSADGRRRLTTGMDGKVFLDGRSLTRQFHKMQVPGLTPDGSRVVALRGLWEIVVWDAATRREVLAVPNEFSHLRMAWSPDGRRLAVARGNYRVEIWDAATGKELARLPGRRPTQSLAFAPDGRTLATGDQAGAIRLWDLRPLDAPPPP